MPTKKTSKKSAVKKSPRLPGASRKVVTKKYHEAKRGTVAWLIAELKKFPGDMSVLAGDHDETYYDPMGVEVLSVREGYIDEEKGEPAVCIRAW